MADKILEQKASLKIGDVTVTSGVVRQGKLGIAIRVDPNRDTKIIGGTISNDSDDRTLFIAQTGDMVLVNGTPLTPSQIEELGARLKEEGSDLSAVLAIGNRLTVSTPLSIEDMRALGNAAMRARARVFK